MPDYTADHLIPFPTGEEFGDGALGLEEMARAVDTLIEAQNDRLSVLATRPTVIRNRATDLAIATSFPDITWDNESHNNFGAVDFTTPEEGAHPVAGVYPALWRVDLFLHFIATAPVLGDGRSISVGQYQVVTGTTLTKWWQNNQWETNTGGEYMSVSGITLLDRPASFVAEMSFAPNGNVKAGSRMALTRIRSV